MVTSKSLLAVHFCVFVRIGILPEVSEIQSKHVTTGLWRIVGNKGAIAISFNIGETSLLLINCHLTAGQKKNASRENSLHAIERDLNMSPSPCPSPERKRPSFNEDLKMTDRFDCVIWQGDFNFRIDDERPFSGDGYEEMKQFDQLEELKENTDFFDGFEEGEICFPQTYKMKPGTDEYNPKRIPSWTDRILFKQKNGTLEQLEYDSIQSVKISDHRPVYAKFDLQVNLNEEK